VVKEAFTLQNGQRLQHAVKIVRKNITSDEMGNEKLQFQFDHEVSVWRCLSNPFVTPLFSVIETPYATWAFTELFCGGTLYDALTVHQQGLPPLLALKYAYQLASALRYLHQDARVVHRDVKLENCVIDSPGIDGGNLKLCDLGLAEFQSFTEGQIETKQEDGRVGGSLAYTAPEQIMSTIPLLDTAIDMWSYGAVVHALTIGELPFSDAFPGRLRDMILKEQWDRPRFSGRVDPEVSEVVVNCLRMEPGLRWTAVDVLGSQWVSLYLDSVSKT
jgi:serine/threonine protein kinase